MIYRLEIENFYSILDKQVIDLRIPANVPDIPGRFAPICAGAKERAPKVVVLFGANAAGKSNVLKAIAFFKNFVRTSFSEPPEKKIAYVKFNNSVGSCQPTRLAIEFSGPESLKGEEVQDQESALYRYGVTFSNLSDDRSEIEYEGLHRKSPNSKRMHRVFERFAGGSVKSSHDFRLGAHHQINSMLRSNASLIATLAQFNHKPSLTIQELFTKISTNIFIENYRFLEKEILEIYSVAPWMLDEVNNEIQRFDLGIKEVRIENGIGGPFFLFDHVRLNRPMHMILESEGTRNLLKILPGILLRLRLGGVAVVDELDIAVHPTLLPEIIRWFHDTDRNPRGAQLWMTCQNASLFEELEKEEIFLCRKNYAGATEIYGLRKIKGIRRSENLYRGYLGGEFGAVPNIG